MGKNALIATSGTPKAIVQGAKVAAYVIVGFSFSPYISLLAAIIVAVAAGSVVGKMIRSKIPEAKFRVVIKVLLSALALRMMMRVFI